MHAGDPRTQSEAVRGELHLLVGTLALYPNAMVSLSQLLPFFRSLDQYLAGVSGGPGVPTSEPPSVYAEPSAPRATKPTIWAD
jgi:hypothetical protein